MGLDKHLQDHPSNENSAKSVKEDSEYAPHELGKESELDEASQASHVSQTSYNNCDDGIREEEGAR